MDINFVMAQVCGALSMVSSVCSMQFKRRRAILVALFCLNLFATLNMVFLKSWAAAYISGFAMVEMVINYGFERKRNPVPRWLVGVYVGVIVALGAVNFAGVMDALPILAATVFCFTILMRKEQNIRKMTLVNQGLWLVFDASVGAYALVVSNVLTIISTAVAYVRYRKKSKRGRRKRG